MDLDVALAGLRDAYTRAPVQEHVEFIVRKNGATSKSAFIVRIDPVKAKTGASPEACQGLAARLELGEVQVWWTPQIPPNITVPPAPAAPSPSPQTTTSRLIVTHERDASTVFVAPITGVLTGQSLSDALLPVPVPQLAWALTPDSGVARTMPWLTPYTPSITWESASITPASRVTGDILLIGTCEPLPATPTTPPQPDARSRQRGRATLAIDETTGRLRRFTAQVNGGEVDIELRVRPADPMARADWPIDPGARRRVDSLVQLTSGPGDAAAANRFPDLVLQDLKGREWEPSVVFAPTPTRPGVPKPLSPDRLVLLFVRQSAEPAPNARVFDRPAAREALALIDRLGLTPSASKPTPEPPNTPAFARRVVVVLDTPGGETAGLLDAAGKEWGDDTLWAASPGASLGRFTSEPSVGAAVVVVRSDLTLAAVIPIDPKSSTASVTSLIEPPLRQALGLPPRTPDEPR